MLMPGDLAVLQAIQVLLKFQKMLVGVHTLNCRASRQLHEDVSLHVSLGVGHHKINGPHVPSQQKGHEENAPDYCPRYHGGKGGPVGVTKHMAMDSSAQTGLPLQDDDIGCICKSGWVVDLTAGSCVSQGCNDDWRFV